MFEAVYLFEERRRSLQFVSRSSCFKVNSQLKPYDIRALIKERQVKRGLTQFGCLVTLSIEATFSLQPAIWYSEVFDHFDLIDSNAWNC